MSVISIKADSGFEPISALQGSPGVAGATGVGITSVSAGQSTNNDIYTITPVTFEKSDGSSDTINIQAYNGYKMSDTVDLIYPIDSIFITSKNENPSSVLGGTWKLIDKEFKSEAGNSNSLFNANATNCEVNNFYFARSKNSVSIRFNFKNLVELNDSTVVLGNFNFPDLGINELPYGLYYVIGSTDNGNGLFISFIDYASGQMEIRDTISKESSGNISSNSSCYLLFEFVTTFDNMIDSFCDKFYWKRTA